jgi:hypothetical protein
MLHSVYVTQADSFAIRLRHINRMQVSPITIYGSGNSDLLLSA